MRIETDDLSRPAVLDLLREHLDDMRAISPRDSVHALDVSGLQSPDVTFWTLWDDGELLACGALREIDPTHGEIKSMRTPARRRGRGAARRMLEHLLAEARRRGYRRVSLETGATAHFVPARTLYASAGFVSCGPFGHYRLDPHSAFMTLELTG
jgi:putative acetyltransferase